MGLAVDAPLSATALLHERDNARRALLQARLQLNLMRQTLIDLTAQERHQGVCRYLHTEAQCRQSAARVLVICERLEAGDLSVVHEYL